ncbi:Phosphatase and actin regulator 4 [Chytridiales sp. JEL 0842]|nr:Phosphatase and actin regulator 4 [Chytridiales sp. JEL 0842]
MELSVDTQRSGEGKIAKIVNELGKKLSRRQDKEELVNKNILKDEDAVSPTLLQTKLSLEKEKNQDALNRRLSRRPSKIDLKLRNILRVDSDDSLHQSGASLDKSIDIQKRANELRSCLKKRPDKAVLEDKNIIKGINVDPKLIETQERLRRAQLENTLDGMLRNRPGIDELAEKQIILHFNETVEVLPTFRKSEYNRKPDGNATFRKLTPQMKIQIREELNTFKKTEMNVHEQSASNTCFH